MFGLFGKLLDRLESYYVPLFVVLQILGYLCLYHISDQLWILVLVFGMLDIWETLGC